MILDEDLDGDLGTLDVVSLNEIRSTFTGLDGLIDVARFEDPIDPVELQIHFSDGIGSADTCRLDIRWYRKGFYSIHHSDSSDRNFRWDYHPKADAPNKHFHPPSDAPSTDPEPSCITLTEPTLVARAVHKLWRRAYDTGQTAKLNSAEGDL